MPLVDFNILIMRALDEIRGRVRGGNWSERGLARLAGLSQPHVHNVLKGMRELTPATADILLAAIRVEVMDLLTPDEIQRALDSRPNNNEFDCEITVLSRNLGPGTKWPVPVSPLERYRLPAELLFGLGAVSAARVSADPLMPRSFESGELFILDASYQARNQPEPRDLCLVDWRGEALLRWVRLGRDRIYIAHDLNIDGPFEWEWCKTGEHGIAAVVLARAVPLANLRRDGPPGGNRRGPPGTCSEPFPRYAAS